jgi:hypothetical protein
MTELTLSLPDDLATRLAARAEQLPRIIEAALERLEFDSLGEFSDLRDVLERLAALPTAEEVLQLRPSPVLQARISELLDKNRSGGLTPEEEAEFSRYEFLEHLVRLAKAQAQRKLKQA